MRENDTLLSICGLNVNLFTEEAVANVVQDISFSINKSETFALVGESGCGKSMTALSIMRLVPVNLGEIVADSIMFGGENLLNLSEKQMHTIRGNKIAMIFQEPATSLNPVYTVGEQIVEAIRKHKKKNLSEAWSDAVDLLQRVDIANSKQRIHQYPHQLSGGMQQRIMIAMAVSCEPELLIADEPTTALDVTTQAQILDLLNELQKQNKMSVLLITHDLGIVADRAQDVAVMYASKIVEKSNASLLFEQPLHPYTKGLLMSLPQTCIDRAAKRLQTIPGTVPDPLHFPSGCKFHPRCPIGRDDKRCQTIEPKLKEVQPGQNVACWHTEGYEKKQEEYESKNSSHKVQGDDR